MSEKVTTRNGRVADFETLVFEMDDQIREYLHNLMAPCADQDFLDAYEREHYKKFGEEWEYSKINGQI